MKLSIVDYKSGNISSVINSFKEVTKDKVNIETDLASKSAIEKLEKIGGSIQIKN